jgi:signal recognition particle receptor subunit beta
MYRSCFVLGMELAMRIVRNSAETSFNGAKPDEMMIEGIVSMIRIIQVQIGSGRMELPDVWTPEEIDEVRRIS